MNEVAGACPGLEGAGISAGPTRRIPLTRVERSGRRCDTGGPREDNDEDGRCRASRWGVGPGPRPARPLRRRTTESAQADPCRPGSCVPKHARMRTREPAEKAPRKRRKTAKKNALAEGRKWLRKAEKPGDAGVEYSLYRSKRGIFAAPPRRRCLGREQRRLRGAGPRAKPFGNAARRGVRSADSHEGSRRSLVAPASGKLVEAPSRARRREDCAGGGVERGG